MPLFEDTGEVEEFGGYAPAVTKPKPTPGVWDTFEAGFLMENPVMNAARGLAQPAFQADSAFRPGEYFRNYDAKNRTTLMEQYSDRLYAIQSEDEALYTIGKIREEEEANETLQRAGWLGVVAATTAGLLSPETFIPFVSGGRGLAAVARGAGYGLAAAAPAEAILYGAQETRTPSQVAFNLAASTALSGLLGGAVSLMTKAEREAAEAEIIAVSRPQGVGAAAVEVNDPGGLASGGARVAALNDSTYFFTNPVTQTINQEDLPQWRLLMQQLSDSGVKMEGNDRGIASAVGGTVENNVTTYMGPLARTIEDSDAQYAKYMFDGNVPRFAPNVRAALAGTFNAGGKLTRTQFKDEVSRAIWNGFEHEIPEVVAAAKEASRKVLEPILKEAQSVGLLGEDLVVVGDRAYLSRLYNVEAIQTRTAEFVEILMNNRERQLQEQFAGDFKRLQEKQAKGVELAEDLARPADEIETLTQTFKDELSELDEAQLEIHNQLEEDIAAKRSQAKTLLTQPASLERDAKRKELLKEARELEREADPMFKETKQRRATIRRRLSNLTKAVVAVGARQAKKLEKVARIEELNLDAMQRVIRKAQTTLRQLDQFTDEKLDAEVTKLRDQFASVSSLFDRGEERLAKLAADEPESARLGALEDLQQKRSERLDDIAENLENAENLDRESVRNAIQYGLDKTMLAVDDITRRRDLRRARLQEAAAKLDPAVAERQIAEIRAAGPRAEGDFARRWEEAGAEAVDPHAGVANFREQARADAESIKDTIVGTYLRLPYSEVLQKERGPELARTLDIPSNEIADFLETNSDRILSVYTRTLAPDIELMRKFGSNDWRMIIKPAVDELNAKLAGLKGKPKETRALNAKFAQLSNNFEAVIQRLRGVRGLPAEPDGFAYRAGKVLMDLNVLRMMGMVTVSSLPDLARPIMRYGLTRTFRDGFGPLIGNLQMFKLNAQEARLAGAAVDTVIHQRASALTDITDDMRRGSKFEKGVSWATNRMGLVALFDYWTQGGKLLTSSITNAKLMDSLAVVNGAEGNLSAQAATSFLAENGINGELAQRIWNEVVTNGGGSKVNGVWWPNTESWKDPGLVRTYRAALAREINNTIVTPGVEKPLLADANMIGRMLYQFKSFGMSSTPKMLIAGLQQRDAAFMSGTVASLALGAISYWLWAMATGGRAQTEMENAGIDKWADEAISRSGIMGTAGELQRIAGNIPGLSQFASLSGTRQTRRPGDNLVEALLGPSFDFLQGAAGVVSGLHEPTQATVKQAVRLLPYNNTLGLREAIEGIEAALATQLPERRN